MIFLQEIEAVNSIVDGTLKVSKGIADYGMMIIVASIALIFGVLMMVQNWMRGKSNQAFIDSVLAQSTSATKELVESTKATLQVIVPLIQQMSIDTKQVVEETKTVSEKSAKSIMLLEALNDGMNDKVMSQIRIIISKEFESSMNQVLNECGRIHDTNHILGNEDKLKTKLTELVTNIYNQRNDDLELFNYREQKLSDFVSKEWIGQCVEICYNNLVQDFEWKRIKGDLSRFYEGVRIEFLKHLKR